MCCSVQADAQSQLLHVKRQVDLPQGVVADGRWSSRDNFSHYLATVFFNQVSLSLSTLFPEVIADMTPDGITNFLVGLDLREVPDRDNTT